MDDEKKHGFSGPVTAFHERRLPETATPAGYAALIEALRLRVPVPRILSAMARTISSMNGMAGAFTRLGTPPNPILRAI